MLKRTTEGCCEIIAALAAALRSQHIKLRLDQFLTQQHLTVGVHFEQHTSSGRGVKLRRTKSPNPFALSSDRERALDPLLPIIPFASSANQD